MKVSEACKTLGITVGFDPNALKQAYHKLALKHHPDKNGGCDKARKMFEKIKAAYDFLSNPDRKDDAKASEIPPRDSRRPKRSQTRTTFTGSRGFFEEVFGRNPQDIFGDIFGEAPSSEQCRFGNSCNQGKKCPRKHDTPICSHGVGCRYKSTTCNKRHPMPFCKFGPKCDPPNGGVCPFQH